MLSDKENANYLSNLTRPLASWGQLSILSAPKKAHVVSRIDFLGLRQ